MIYFSIAPFIDNIKFPLWNLNINNLILSDFHISLITKRFFRTFDRYRDKILTLSELLQDINNFSKTIVEVIRKSHEFSFEIVRVITIVVSNPVNFLVNARLWRQSIASWYSMRSRFSAILLLIPPSYILCTLDRIVKFETISYIALLMMARTIKYNYNAWKIVLLYFKIIDLLQMSINNSWIKNSLK